MEIGNSKLSINRSNEFTAYLVFIVFFAANYFANSSVYSFLLLIFGAFLAIRYKPVLLIIPCVLADTAQGYFLITETLSFNRILSLIFIFSCIIHYRKIECSRFTIIPICLSLYVLASSLWSVTGSYSESIAFVISMAILIMMASMDDVNRDEFYKLFSIAFIIYGLSLSLLTLIRSGGLKASQFVFDEAFNANTISCSIALAVCIIYGTYSIGKGFNKIITYGFVVICLVSILIIGSRASLISLVGSIVITYIATSRYNGKALNPKTVIAFFLVAVGIGATLFFVMQENPDIYNRFTFSSANVKDIYSITRRTEVWKALVVHIIPQHFLFGVGFGLLNVKTIVAPYVLYAKHAHNMYLAIMSETGIIGTLLFLSFFIHYFAIIVKSKKIDKVFLIAIISFALINGFAEEMINQRWMWISFGLCDVLLKDKG